MAAAGIMELGKVNPQPKCAHAHRRIRPLVPFVIGWQDGCMGNRGGRQFYRCLLLVLLTALPACANNAPDAEQVSDDEGSGTDVSRLELVRSDTDTGRYTAYARTYDDGKSICLDVAEPGRGIGGGCNPVPDEALHVEDESTGGLVFGYLTGHPEVVQVRVVGGGREVDLPLREEELRPAPVHRFSGKPIPIRFFGAADRVALNDYTVVALDRDGNVVEVPTTSS